MGFLSPWFLAGAAAVGLPIYLHLLRRHTTTPHPFSSLMFFESRTQSSTRHRRLRYLLLLSLRLALLLLLVFAFANPYINRPAASASADKLLLIVIDNSLSMRASTRFADAKQEAMSVLAGRGATERAQVSAIGSQFQLFTQPVQDGATLRAAVDSVQPGDSRASYGELARAMRAMSETVHTPIELHLFSDMQKSDMPASFAEMALPENVSLVLHPEAKDGVPNWAVESVNAPAQVWDTKKARVDAVIAGYGTKAAMRNASLVINGKVSATRPVEVPAGGRATVEFTSLDVPYGFTHCEVRIDSADALAADDTYFFSVERSDPQRVLFVHQSADTRSPLYFTSALASATESAFVMDSVTVEHSLEVQPSKYAFVILSDAVPLPPAFETELIRYVRGGGSVLVAVGPSSSRGGRVPVFGDNILGSHYYSRDAERFATVGDVDTSYSLIDSAGRWSGVRFFYAVSVDPSNSRVIARLHDQTPLLLDKKIGEGRVLLLASGLDNLTNDFPLHPIFVPFVEQTSLYLSGMESRNSSRLVDSFLDLRTADLRSANAQAVGVEVVDPQGHQPLSLKEASSAQSFQLTSAGFYQVRLANGKQDLIAVDADRRESDLSVIPDDVLALWRHSTSTETQQASADGAPQQTVKNSNLWWYAMLLGLAVALAESALASRYLGTSREEP